MDVSLVFTVLNEAESIDQLLEAIDGQTRPPDEIMVVDGGSTDDTVQRIEKWAAGRDNVYVGTVKGANISTGRNRAIAQAKGPVIAVTDAGCVPEPTWLENLVKPLEDPDVRVSMGYYTAQTEGFFEGLTGCLNIPDASEIDAEKFMPSSRSVAFLKMAWGHVNGYPQWLDVGEDMYFNFSIRTAELKRVFAPDAVVRWRLRPTLRAFLRQYFHYARGDALGGMYMYRHAARFFAYIALVALTPAWIVGPVWLLVPATVAGVWLRKALRRAFSRLPLWQAVLSLVALPVLEAMMDVAKMGGYLTGLLQTWKTYSRPKPQP